MRTTPIGRRSEMLLYMAARAQLVDEVIRPRSRPGKIVVSDRYLLANVVYQGHAGGLDRGRPRSGACSDDGIVPDCVFLFDMAPEAADGGSIGRWTGWRARVTITADACARVSSPRRPVPTAEST